MLIKRPDDIRPSEITDEAIYRDRRRFLRGMAIGGAALAGAGLMLPMGESSATASLIRKYPNLESGPYPTDEALTPFDDVTSYNNFYEFGFRKDDPKKHAHMLTSTPWSFTVAGEAEITGAFQLEDILKPHTMEERIYRLRCVEAWSMVIPWVGFPLSDLIRRFKPTSRAKYVEFTTLHNPEEMPGQKVHVLEWPYVEGLRMDEAMHPLTTLAVGLYGQAMPNQNGAPLRLVVPWKYGFKSIKSIVKIRFTETQPQTTWNKAGPEEYGFYSNVNPDVSHPRWNQGRERRIGEFFKRKTLPFNGYAEQVAHLYNGMDLKKFY